MALSFYGNVRVRSERERPTQTITTKPEKIGNKLIRSRNGWKENHDIYFIVLLYNLP